MDSFTKIVIGRFKGYVQTEQQKYEKNFAVIVEFMTRILFLSPSPTNQIPEFFCYCRFIEIM